MFKRQTAADGFTKDQQKMLRQYQTMRSKAVSGQLSDIELLHMGMRPQQSVIDLAIALDRYGTPLQRETFIDLERAVMDRVIGISSDALPEYIRVALASEAKAGWPSVRSFPMFAGMERSMRANGHGDEVFETTSFIGPNTATARIVWLSAFGGPTPISWMDMAKSMSCADAVAWIQRAKIRLEHHVNELLAAR